MGNAQKLKGWAASTYKDVLQIVSATTKDDAIIPHFIVCDNDMVRDEEPHGPLDDNTNANEVCAEVFFNNHSKARVFSSRFNAMWDALGGNR